MNKDFFSTFKQSKYFESSKLYLQENADWSLDGRFDEVLYSMNFAEKDYEYGTQLKDKKWNHHEEVRQFKMLSSPLEGESPPGPAAFF